MDENKIPHNNDSDESDFDQTSVPESDSSFQSHSQDDLSNTNERKMLEDLLRWYVGDITDEDEE
jgi:hypothetical protein